MDWHLWTFVGVPVRPINETYEKVGAYIEKAGRFICEHLHVNPRSYPSLLDMAEQNQGYGWEWMKERVVPFLRELSAHPIKETDEGLDLLDHRLYVLDLDVESGKLDNVLHSISDTVNQLQTLCCA